MTFGKHRGKPLDQVPTAYLQWCLRTRSCYDTLYAAIVQEVSDRIERCQELNDPHPED
jgi:uncharacterized protein (DUF3820 family)